MSGSFLVISENTGSVYYQQILTDKEAHVATKYDIASLLMNIEHRTK